MINLLKKHISQQIINIPGWHTNRKIVVIESDDWGSIRMPSTTTYDKFIKDGIKLDKCPYNRYDSLASSEDLTALFEVLLKFRDINGNFPAITANAVVSNPDFEKIKSSGFNSYYCEPFTKTLSRNPAHEGAFSVWKQGMDYRIFQPQFHGREHVNIALWLKLLKDKNRIFLKAFDHGFWGIGPEIVRLSNINIQASLDTDETAELAEHKKIINEGLEMFKNLFEYKSTSFIANNFIWDSSLNKVLKNNGVAIIQGMKYQISPIFKNKKRKLTFHYTGEKNKLKQIYLVRNCKFEPTENPSSDSVSNCLIQINNAFFWRKPAIISSHRLNFIGSINRENRTKNLILFKYLLNNIISRWPDVEFLTTDDLGDIILASKPN